MGSTPDGLDVVYTWVDDAAPGYSGLLERYARTAVDTDPARTRDNLDMLRYSLRSLQHYVPWVRDVYLVTQRPQAPSWLDTSTVRIVHHDEIMPEDHLPTFSSFAIVSNLHRIPGISRRFVYVEDDCFFAAPLAPSALLDGATDRAIVHMGFGGTPSAQRSDDARLSPWNLGLAWSNHLLDERYGPTPRRMVRHAPIIIDVKHWQQMETVWPTELERTSAARFRGPHTVAVNHHYPHYLLHEGLAVEIGGVESWHKSPYNCLGNLPLLERLKLAVLDCHRPQFFCMNDNFGPAPDLRVVSMIRRWLQRRFPWPSRFERADPDGSAGSP